MREAFSKRTKIITSIIALIFTLAIFLILIPKPLSNEDLEVYNNIVNQIAEYGLFPKNSIEAKQTDYLEVIKKAGQITIRPYEYNSYRISIDLNNSTSSGVLEYRVDENGVRGPKWNRDLIIIVLVVSIPFLWLLFYCPIVYIIDKLDKNGFLASIIDYKEEPGEVDLSKELEDAKEFAKMYSEAESKAQSDLENSEIEYSKKKLAELSTYRKVYIPRPVNNRKLRLKKIEEKKRLKFLYLRKK